MEAVAAHGYRIAISGTAADELFTGYYDHHLAYLYEVRADAARHAGAKAEWAANIGPFVRNPLLQDPDAFIRNPAMARAHLPGRGGVRAVPDSRLARAVRRTASG